MKCIYCGCTDSRVVDSRPTEDGAIRRRRECEECKRRFTTYEKVETLPVYVIKKDNRREAFDADKVRNGILKACEKRPVSIEAIEKLVRQVEFKACQQPDQEITTEQIGRIVMDGPAQDLANNEDVKEFYLGVGGEGRRSFKDVKSYKRRKRWLA